MQSPQRRGETGVRQDGRGEQRPPGGAAADVRQHIGDEVRADVDHPVAEPLAGGGAAVMRVIGIEDHHHPGRACVRGAAAREGLGTGFGDAERVSVVTVPVVHVLPEVGMHGFERLVR